MTLDGAASNGGSAITGYTVTPYVGAVAAAAPDVQLHRDHPDRHRADQRHHLHVQVPPSTPSAPDPRQQRPNADHRPARPRPDSPTATAGNARPRVSWTAPASNGGSPITGYVVTPYIGGVAQPPQTFNSTATTQTVTGLTNGTTYTFKVAAINAVGTGPPSAASNAVTPRPPPGAPTIGTATAGQRRGHRVAGPRPHPTAARRSPATSSPPTSARTADRRRPSTRPPPPRPSPG